MLIETTSSPRLRAPARRYTITVAGRMTGLTARAIRIYEARGLISPERSGDRAVRYYGEADVAALSRIADARRAGLSIREISDLIEVGRRHGQPAQMSRLAEICRVKAVALDLQRRELERLAQEALSLAEPRFSDRSAA
jgi:DNA-binding transcriptional MerR regulator